MLLECSLHKVQHLKGGYMPIINRSDLKYDYSWSTKPSDHPRKTTTETDSQSRVFRSNDGDEILSFINTYAESHNIDSKQKALEVEEKIRGQLNKGEMTRGEIQAWLQNNI